MEIYGNKFKNLQKLDIFKTCIERSGNMFIKENKTLNDNETYNLIVIKKEIKTELDDGSVCTENMMEKSIHSKNLDYLIKQAHEFFYSHKDNISYYCFDVDNNYNISFSFDLKMEKDEIYYYTKETEFCLFITKAEFI